jgi:hypothetical protein
MKNDLVERLLALDQWPHHTGVRIEAAAEIECLRTALRDITDHFAGVMGGPMIKGAGIKFENGVEGIPTIAAARAALGDN